MKSPESNDFELSLAQIIRVFTDMGYPRKLIEQWTLPPKDAQTLVKIIEGFQPGNILEVGTFIGLSTLLMALVSPAATHIHTIDPNFPLETEMESMRSKLYDSDKTVKTHDIAGQAAARLGVEDKITFHSGGFSTARTFASYNSSPASRVQIVGPEVCDHYGPFDFIFIDGLHYEEDVYADMNLAAAHLAPTGLIALHDVLGPWGSNVRRAIFRFLENHDDFTYTQDKFSKVNNIIGLLKPRSNKLEPLNKHEEKDLKRGGLVQQKIFSNLSAVLLNIFSPASVLQMGGDITLLEQMKNMGVSEVQAYVLEPQDVPPNSIPINKLNTQEKFAFEKKYDLCLMLEILDLLDSQAVDNLLQAAVEASDTIIFAGSPPGELGLLQPNNKPISYWVNKFYEKDFIFEDVIRPILEPINFSDTLIPDYNFESSYLINLYVVKKDKQLNKSKSLKAYFKELLVKKESRIEDLELQNLYHKCIVQQKQQEYRKLSSEYEYLSTEYEKISRENYELHHEMGTIYILDRRIILNTLGRIKQKFSSILNFKKK